MPTNQPQWRKIGTLGDVNPLAYGGAIVYVDRTGHYVPEMEWIVSDNEDSDDGAPWTVYRILIEDTPETEWWYDQLPAVAATVGATVETLRAEFVSADPMIRARAYESLIGYFGPDEFDQYPNRYAKRSELPHRLRKLG